MKNKKSCASCKDNSKCICKEIRQTLNITDKSNVEHPDYYLSHTGHEVIDVINAWELNFSLGNAVKYIARAGKKDVKKEIEDLEKAKFYIELQINSIKNSDT
jgi:hypothetical protein